MQVERSNFKHTEHAREIPSSCPVEMRAKIMAAREQRTAPKQDAEGWDLLKQFASQEA